jgi:hypothetical protein
VFANLTNFLRELDEPTCLIVHHDTKTGSNYRGSSAIFGFVDGMLAVERYENQNCSKLSCDGFREGEPFNTFDVQFAPPVMITTAEGEQKEIAVLSLVEPKKGAFSAVADTPIDDIQAPPPPPRTQLDIDSDLLLTALETPLFDSDWEKASGVPHGRYTKTKKTLAFLREG